LGQLWAFQSREFLRAFVVGKEISFASIHSLPSNDDVPRDIGTAESNGIDLVSEILKNGWGKSKENKREPTPEDLRRKKLEDEAREAGKGIWKTDAPVVSFDSLDIHEMYSFVLPRYIKSITQCQRTLRPSYRNGRASQLKVASVLDLHLSSSSREKP